MASSKVLNIERAHLPFTPNSLAVAPPRSIVLISQVTKRKRMCLKEFARKKGFNFQGKRIQLDPDKHQRCWGRSYTQGKKNEIPDTDQTTVFYKEGTMIYGSAVEATAERGIPVTVLKNPAFLSDQWTHWHGEETERILSDAGTLDKYLRTLTI